MSTGHARGVLLEEACCCGPPGRVFPRRLLWRKICVTHRGWEANQCRVTTTSDMERHIWRIKQTVNKHWLDLKCFWQRKNIFSSSGRVAASKCGFTEYGVIDLSIAPQGQGLFPQNHSLAAWLHKEKMKAKATSLNPAQPSGFPSTKLSVGCYAK